MAMDSTNVGLLTSLSLSFLPCSAWTFPINLQREHLSEGDSKEFPVRLPSMQQLQIQEWLQDALEMHMNLLHGWLCEGSMIVSSVPAHHGRTCLISC